MQLSVSEAEGRLSELVKRAKGGEEIVLTRDGQPEVRLVAVRQVLDREARRKLLEEISGAAAAKATPGPCAARSQDFLYDGDGLPR